MKIIFVTGDDYAALEFEQSHKGLNILQFITEHFDGGERNIEYIFENNL